MYVSLLTTIIQNPIIVKQSSKYKKIATPAKAKLKKPSVNIMQQLSPLSISLSIKPRYRKSKTKNNYI